ncbi:MAG: EthD family reductase [Anaerolineales bacterium]|nr:EthD family reductase [Anaerolineales bacterium]
MHKLVILIEEQEDWTRFETQWPAFLRLAEEMPGLLRESTSRVERHLFGSCSVGQMHGLYFNTLAEAETALTSPAGMAAGRLLQQFSGGRLTLFLADHKQDELENIRKFKPAEE